MRQTFSYCLLVFILALLVRVGGLSNSDIAHFPPAGMVWFDEGLKGVDAWNTLHGGGFKLVYPDVFPREPLLVWVLAVVMKLFGPKIVLLRLTTAIISSFACVAFFLMVREVEGKRGKGFALAAAFILCTMHWHAWFGRLLFRTNFVPLISSLVVLCMALAARRTGRFQRLAWAGAGLVWGMGYYTYLSWHFFFPAAIFWLWALTTSRAVQPDCVAPLRLRKCALYVVFGVVLMALPMMLHYATASQDLTGRPTAISPFKDGVGPGIKLMLDNLRDVVLMFGIRGDHVPLHNVSPFVDKGQPGFGKTGMPVFEPVFALFFFAGIVRALRDARRGADRATRRISAAWLVWLGCMSLPSVVTQTDSANTLRNLGATPAVAYFVALGWWWACEATHHVKEQWRKHVSVLLMLLLLWGAAFQIFKLWVLHPRVQGIERAFTAISAELTWVCKRDAKSSPIYVPDMFFNKSFEFLNIDRPDVHRFDPVEAISQGKENLDHRILCTQLEMNYPALQKLFPNGQIEQEKLFMGKQPFAWMFRIPAKDLLPREKAAEAAAGLGVPTLQPPPASPIERK
ncbi:TPA: hypothetical protein DDW35_02605 [Candidatus Sumerlaeota bacterium]|jgi:hypothetical protein|nr:hypothetical protein [Candidatus Sumerlaeota bacterium]